MLVRDLLYKKTDQFKKYKEVEFEDEGENIKLYFRSPNMLEWQQIDLGKLMKEDINGVTGILVDYLIDGCFEQKDGKFVKAFEEADREALSLGFTKIHLSAFQVIFEYMEVFKGKK